MRIACFSSLTSSICIDVDRKWYKTLSTTTTTCSMSIWKHVLLFYCYSAESSFISIFLLHWSHFSFSLSLPLSFSLLWCWQRSWSLSLEAKILVLWFFSFLWRKNKRADAAALIEKPRETKRLRGISQTIEMRFAWIVIFTYVNCVEWSICVCAFVWPGAQTLDSMIPHIELFRYDLHGSFDWFALNQSRYS